MSPIALGEGVGEAGYDPEFDESSVAVSKRLPDVYRRIAHERGISFLAASAYAKPSEEDREHMNEEGHAALAEAVYAKLKEMLAGTDPCIDESGRERGQKRNLTAVCLTG